MFIAKNNDLIILARETREELEQALKFMVYTDIEETDIEYELYNGEYLTKEEIETIRKEDFEKEFFNTSLGWIRRKVNMADGSTKDFLSDLLPTISMAVQMGTSVNIIAYDKPDFTKEITDWTPYQHIEVVTPQFLQECFMQLSNDFLPINTEEIKNEL